MYVRGSMCAFKSIIPVPLIYVDGSMCVFLPCVKFYDGEAGNDMLMT